MNNSSIPLAAHSGKTWENNRLQFFLVLLIGITLRLFQLTRRSLWLDEYTSLQVSQHDLSGILGGIGFNFHTPPGYYVLLHCWLQLFPTDPASLVLGLRLFSVVFDILNIALIFGIISRQFNPRTGLICALLYSCSAYAIYYAQEGRMYSLELFCVLVTYHLAIDYLTSGARLRSWGIKGMLLVGIATVGMYTHYYYALSLAAITLGVIFELRNDRPRLVLWLALMFVVGLLFLPWVNVVRHLVTSESQDFRRFVTSMLPYTFFRFVAGYGLVPLVYGLKDNLRQSLSENLMIFVSAASIFSVAWIIGSKLLLKSNSKQLSLAVLALVLPPTAAWCISLVKPMLSERYLIVVYPFFLVPIAFYLASAESIARRILSIAICCFGALAIFAHHFNPRFGNTAWDQVARVIQFDPRGTRTVIVHPEYNQELLKFYLPETYRVLPAPVDSTPPLGKCERTGNGCDFWLVEVGNAVPLEEKFSSPNYLRTTEVLFPAENGLKLIYFWDRGTK